MRSRSAFAGIAVLAFSVRGIAVGLWLVFAGRRLADPAIAPAGA
jgi:hypothetical protein